MRFRYTLRYIISLYLLCCFSNVAAQSNPVVDSLEQLLSGRQEDTTKVYLLYSLSDKYSSVNIEKAKQYAQQGLALANMLKHARLSGTMNSQLGLLALDENKTDDALQYFEKAKENLDKAGDDNGLAAVYNNFAMAYHDKSDNEKAVHYYQAALQQKIKLNDKKGAADCYSNIGAVYQDNINTDSALLFHGRSLAIRKELNDSMGMAVSFYNLGAINSNDGNYKASIDYLTQSAAIFENLHKEKNLILVYNTIAGLDRRVGYLTEALKYNEQSLQLALKIKAQRYLPGIYKLKGLLLYQTGKYKQSTDAYNKGLQLSEANHNLNGTCENLCGLATNAIYAKNYDLAQKYYDRAIRDARKSEIQRNIVLSVGGLIELKMEQKDTTGVTGLLKEVLEIASVNKMKAQMKDILQLYAEYYALAGDKEKSLDYYRQQALMSDSIFNKDLSQQFASLHVKYETAKKEGEIKSLKQEKKINMLLLQKRNYQLIATVAALLLLIISVGAYLRRQKMKRILNRQQQLIREAAIKRTTIIETENKERERIAKDLHDELGSGMSKIVLSNELAKKHINGNKELNFTLTNIDKTVVELSGNMKALIWSLYNENATLEALLVKMREFAGDFLEDGSIEPVFHFTENVPAINLSKESVRDIFLSYKEAVNNAVKHAKASKLWLSTIVGNDELEITVADNGIGMNTLRQTASGNGMRHMKERIERQCGAFEIRRNDTGGTTISFILSLNKLAETV